MRLRSLEANGKTSERVLGVAELPEFLSAAETQYGPQRLRGDSDNHQIRGRPLRFRLVSIKRKTSSQFDCFVDL